jgi:hypothetical protein
MTDSQAEKWVITSALVVAGIYGYRRLTETPGQPPVTVKELAGVGELPPLGAWATAWGFTFLVVSVVATAAPGLGAAFAILIATGDLMTNASSIFGDIGTQEHTAAGGTQPLTPAQVKAAANVAGSTPTIHGSPTAGLVHGAGTIVPGGS